MLVSGGGSAIAPAPTEPHSAEDKAPSAAWPVERWVRVLDRIEYREPTAGLRYFGLPIWLEVTMTGPDSDLWPANTDNTLSWDWQSSAPCPDVEELIARGADDDVLLEAVGRYTIENLMLNAVHEIGEWFRLNGRRAFPAHIGGPIGPGERDPQGNGVVALHVLFGQAIEPQETAARDLKLDDGARELLLRRLGRSSSASVFTCVPGTSISYEAAGPVIRTGATGQAVSTWRSRWSTSAIDAARATAHELMPFVARDVHQALISHEADRICRAFHIDGRRPWRLAGPPPPLGAEPPDADGVGTRSLSVLTSYTVSPEGGEGWERGADSDSPRA